MESSFKADCMAGRSVFLAGATSGINLGSAERFAGEGADVYVISRNSEKVDATVASLMQRNVVTMRSDENVERALDLLAAGAIHSVLVLDANEELVGIATNIDLLEYLLA